MDARFLVKGGRPLKGKVEVRGSKNAATKMIVASLLTEETCEIENVPLSEDLDITLELVRRIGSEIELKADKHLLRIRTGSLINSVVTTLTRRNRIPILALGPLLHRKKFAEVPVLGGCPIGHRPINFHIEALKKMGIKIERRPSSYYAEAKKIHGAEIEFPFQSVGATENVILTSVLAEGQTLIRNAAVEPEIMNLVQMLRGMGAKIQVEEKAKIIQIQGVTKLHGVKERVMPDRNEIISFASAALATSGDIIIPNIETAYLNSFLDKLKELNAGFEIIRKKTSQSSNSRHAASPSTAIRFYAKEKYKPLTIKTMPHPGFMTDWASPFAILLTQAYGKSIIHETIYEDRFGYTEDLKRMGANIKVESECPPRDRCRFAEKNARHVAKIYGPTKLKGTQIKMHDIRAGMAHLIAALSAAGESIITGIEHIDRGYEKIDECLQTLGADIKRI